MSDLQTPRSSHTVTLTRIVMPGQTNARGTLFGGVALSLMDEAAAIVALRHARAAVVTAHIDSVDFKAPIYEGEAVEVTATLKMVGPHVDAARHRDLGREPRDGRAPPLHDRGVRLRVDRDRRQAARRPAPLRAAPVTPRPPRVRGRRGRRAGG